MKHRRSLRIYVAGPIQGKSLLESFKNIENGQKWTATLFEQGFSPFPVFCDHSFISKVSIVPEIADVYAYSLAWLRAADAVFVIPNSDNSKGVSLEISEANRLNIPIFENMAVLCQWADIRINAEAAMANSDD